MRMYFYFSIIVTLFINGAVNAQNKYAKQVYLIEMRDGIHLNTEVYHPVEMNEDLPILMTRTPYGLSHDSEGIHRSLSTAYKELADEGYIFVFQDIRGRYNSEGTFVMMRPCRNQDDPNSIDESTDTYDTIDFLMKNLDGHNGKVGVMGISYGGWLTVMALIEPHPALAAVSPQASPSDMYLGDDFLHNGALRLSPAFGYAALMETGKTNQPFQFDQYDTYEFFLEMGPLQNANQKYFHDELPSWNNFMEHPNYDEYWQDLNVDHNLIFEDLPVPILNVAGWWDAEDFYGPMKIYETLEKYDQSNKNYLVVGPWRHGGWARDIGNRLGPINFEEKTGYHFKEEIQAKWFAYHLKGKGDWEIGEAYTFRTGQNDWIATNQWPPVEQISPTPYYLHDDQKLQVEADKEGLEFFDEYISDPKSPVPYMKRPIMGFWQHMSSKVLWKVEDQRFVDGRPDVLSFETDVLDKDVTVSGNIMMNLFASTSGTDSDWIVKLIDVYPENYEENKELSGYQLMIADEVLRGKYRNSFSTPEPVPANAVVEYEISLNSRNHTFKKGHKIMIQIQSTWFPLIDRNPHKFIDIPQAEEKDYQQAVQRIYHSVEYPSHIVLPVVSN